MADYWKLYEKVKVFYSCLGSISCPALNGEQVIFDHRGLRHMVRKNNDRRSKADQIRRLKLLLRIKEILPRAHLGISNRPGFYRLLVDDNGREVRIIILQLKDGRKCYVSIM